MASTQSATIMIGRAGIPVILPALKRRSTFVDIAGGID
jgi:hypothetical protein